MTDAAPFTGTGRLAQKRVLITGGARGIGAEIARRSVSEGATVAILDRLAPQGNATAIEVGGTFVEVDLLDPAATVAATNDAIAVLGGCDVLVNSAGILRFSPLIDLSIDDWNDTFAINTRAMLSTMQTVARHLIAEGRPGKIVNLASMAAKKGGAGEGAYAMSKAAVVALTRVAALEWGVHGITANALCPGYVLTEMGAATRTEAMIAEWSALSPLGRLAEPDDVASVALFLSSSDSDYLTGQAINVTGGMVMH